MEVGKVHYENLKMAGYILKDEEFKKRQELALDTFPDLRNKLSQKAANLSGGERQFLGIATALIRKADIMMLDEPSAMLSPKFSSIIFKKILELKERFNLTILLVEQNIKSALDISDNAYMLKSGKIDFEGTAQNLLKHEKFEKFCIGI
jgi:branched-chain amino acid transport system ATP-binding protein